MTDNASVSPTGSSPDRAWLLALGALMIVLAAIGFGMAYALTVVAVMWSGILVIVAGVAQLLDTVHHRGWRAIVWHVLIALFYVVVGGFMLSVPVKAAFVLTVVIGLSLIGAGIVRIVLSLLVRAEAGTTWLWVLAPGALSLLLGSYILYAVTPPGAEALATPEGQAAWLQSWGWVIGVVVSAELLGNGLSLVALGLASRRPVSSPGAGAPMPTA